MSEQPRVGDRKPHVPFPFEARQWLSDAARVECVDGRDSSDVVHEGVVIGFTEAPTVRVQKDDGQIVTWVLGLTRLAQSYVDELPEWEQELLAQEEARRSSVDPHKPVVLKQADTGDGFEPKVWHSTGEEPPRDGRCLEYIDISDNVLHYLKNFGDMWLWVEAPDAPDPRPEIGQWPPRHPGRYREVEAS